MIKTFNDFKEYLQADINKNFNTPISLKQKIFNNRYKFFLFLRLSMFFIYLRSQNDSLYIKLLNRICLNLYFYYQNKFQVEISPYTKIGKGLSLPHLNGIVIHHKVKIGDYCSILQQVTIGNNMNKGRNNLAVIGNNVFIGAGAKIIGPCKIGNNVQIGANAVVINNIIDNMVVGGIPAKVLKEHK